VFSLGLGATETHQTRVSLQVNMSKYRTSNSLVLLRISQQCSRPDYSRLPLTASLLRKRPLSSIRAETSLTTLETHKRASQVIDVSGLAHEMRREVRAYTLKCNQEGNPVRLAGIMAVDAMKDTHYAKVYASNIQKKLDEDGILYEHVECHGKEPEDVEATIEALNERPDVHGILVYYPIFTAKLADQGSNKKQRQNRKYYLNAASGVYFKSYDDYLRDVVCPEKDVEGLSNGYNSRWLFRARSRSHFRRESEIYLPCTALAVEKVIETYHTFSANPNSEGHHQHQPWSGTTATVINRSEILGRPLAAMMALKGANVYSIDEHSILKFMGDGKLMRCAEPHMTLEWCLGQSTLIVTGVPHEDFQLPIDSIQAENATVVNVSEHENLKEEDVYKRPGITSIPKIGKVTVAALEHNLISLHKECSQKLRKEF